MMTKNTTKGPRALTLRILRSSPSEGVTPHWQDFHVEEAEGMTLFIALNEIRETLDPALQFDFVCRAGICGSCGMLIDGKPGLACRSLTRDLGSVITLAPLPVFEAEPEPPVPSACLAALLALDPDSLTPREALDALYRLKGMAAE